MIKYVRQKSRENSIKAAKSFLKKKGESNDSGTESDGDILDAEKQHQIQHHNNIDFDMEASVSSCLDANTPTTDTACSSESSAMMCQSNLLYDQHSSEEELEVINGPSSVAAAEAAAVSSSMLAVRGTTSSLMSEGCSSSLGAADTIGGDTATYKRSSSTINENRKRSLAHSSEDEFRNFLEPILTPVNFRTTPPLEAFKPNRSHMFRSTTPLILSEARCGIENIKLCDNSVNDENNGDNDSTGGCEETNGGTTTTTNNTNNTNNTTTTTTTSTIKACASSLKISNSSHHIYQPQPKYTFHYNSSRSSPASTTGLDVDSVRSVSPPAKLFHCAISPKRRPIQRPSAAHTSNSTTQQRLQRPHRPCLDFDKMQQVSL